MDVTTDKNVDALLTSETNLQHASEIESVTPKPTALPEHPLVVIEPNESWTGIDVNEVWAYRELLYFLIWRDVKVRYKQTALGAAWAIMQPLFTMLIFTIFFGRLAGVPSDNVPYPIFAYAGLLPWTFFSNAVSTSGNSLISSANLITKVYFPRALIPVASVGAALLDLAIAFAIMIPLMVYYRVSITLNVLMLPVVILLTTLLAIGVGIWLAALNVKFRDIRFAVPFLIQLWLFVSPVIYPMSFLPERFRWVLSLNPLSGIIEGYRSSLLGLPFNWFALSISAGITFAILAYALYIFRKMEKNFADII